MNREKDGVVFGSVIFPRTFGDFTILSFNDDYFLNVQLKVLVILN